MNASEDVIHEVELKTSNAMSELQAAALVKVSAEVLEERMRQHDKWGEQSWPDFISGPYTDDVEYRAHSYGLPTEAEAKTWLEEAFSQNTGTFGHILVEEVAEVFGTKTQAELRAELIQVAAVAQAWVEKIDRDTDGSEKETRQ